MCKQKKFLLLKSQKTTNSKQIRKLPMQVLYIAKLLQIYYANFKNKIAYSTTDGSIKSSYQISSSTHTHTHIGIPAYMQNVKFISAAFTNTYIYCMYAFDAHISAILTTQSSLTSPSMFIERRLIARRAQRCSKRTLYIYTYIV